MERLHLPTSLKEFIAGAKRFIFADDPVKAKPLGFVDHGVCEPGLELLEVGIRGESGRLHDATDA